MGGARLLRYVVRRLLQAIPVVLGVVVLNFLLLQLAPGDAATVLAGEAGGAPLEYIQQLRERFGLDQPILVQLALYLKNILVLDLGYSFRNASPVLPLILARLWPTLLLMGTTLLLSVAGGVLLGLLAAVAQREERVHHGVFDDGRPPGGRLDLAVVRTLRGLQHHASVVQSLFEIPNPPHLFKERCVNILCRRSKYFLNRLKDALHYELPIT